MLGDWSNLSRVNDYSIIHCSFSNCQSFLHNMRPIHHQFNPIQRDLMYGSFFEFNSCFIGWIQRNKLTLSSLLSSIVSSPLASHCPSCVQLLLNLCPTDGRSTKDCIVTTTPSQLSLIYYFCFLAQAHTGHWFEALIEIKRHCSEPMTSPPFHSPIRSQPTFAFSFPSSITGQQIKVS